jgi:UDP-N-acetylglucosamine 2-epimerase (non-hydrolysing)/GDP/UDP-N,N'-diacetylbacillosamine 2-epimerase (hydrolysing)
VTTLQALKKANINVIIILPNNDAGFSNIIREVKSSNFKYIETLSISDYINLLKRSIGLIGNSSSGIHETATFNIPTINIGSRQNKRLRPNNVIDVDHNEIQILKAIRKCLKSKDENKKFFNPYGDGDSALKIISIIKNLDLSNNIIQKTITY